MGTLDTESALSATDDIIRPSTPAAPQLVNALLCDRPTVASSRHALANVHEVIIGRGEREASRGIEDGVRRLRLSIPDRAMSSAHARVVGLRGRWVLEDTGSKNGTRVNGVPVERAVLLDGDTIELGHSVLLYRDEVPVRSPELADLDGETLDLAGGTATFVASLAAAFDALGRAARSEVAIAVEGETGTGKEVVARAAHALSGRPGAFVPVNCGAIPTGLVEAALFGHKKGAFSGAVEDRPGLVRAADRGTLFLDEIGDLPPAAQAAFLRVLEAREVLPVGDARPTKVDFRVITATHRALPDLVAQGSFRADLYARLSGFALRLPPLRERREDLGLLVAALLRRLRPGETTAIHVKAARALYAHGWPLNVRELEKVLATALALADKGAIRPEHLPEALQDGADTPEDGERLRTELVALLEQHHGNVAAVARTMGKGRMQIHRWLKRYGLTLEDYRR